MTLDKLVKTIDGIEYPQSKCRKIADQFHKIGDPTIMGSGQCYLINDKYYRESTGYIVYDYDIKKYILKNNDLIHGIIDYIYEKFEYGWFTPNHLDNVVVHNDFRIICLNDSIIKKNKSYRELLTNGEYYAKDKFTSSYFTKIIAPSSNIKRKLTYDSTGIIKNYMKDYDENYNPVISNNINKYGDVLEDLTFGLEFETVSGYIPHRITRKLGLMPLRDGSVSGLEYVTIPLSGKKGLQSVVETCSVLNERTKYDDSCALHLHLGNVPRTMEFMVALYRVLAHVQDDFYKMFPIYKKYNFGVKRKNYTKPLPNNIMNTLLDNKITKDNIVDNFNELFEFLSMGVNYKNNYDSLDDVKSHPSDPYGDKKWQIKTRYYWVNMIPLLFGNKETIEFRIHTPTYDPNKIIDFITICASIINYTKKNTTNILENYKSGLSKLSLNQVVESNITHCIRIKNLDDRFNLIDKINSYIKERFKKTNLQNQNGNIIGNESDIKSNFNFNWDNTSIHKKNSGIINYNVENIRDTIITLTRNFRE
jgi:hypothetical protein